LLYSLYSNPIFVTVNSLKETKNKIMAKITENDIVDFLQQKIDSLKAELKKAEDVLEALKGSAPAPTKPAAAVAKVRSLTADTGKGPSRKRKQRVASAAAGQAPAKKRAGRPKTAVSATLEAPEAYDSKLKMESKVAYALSKTGSAFKEEVTKMLNDLEPEADPKKLDKDVTVKLSSLYKKGRINAVREGRKYRYSL
jgi:hypothetical protein